MSKRKKPHSIIYTVSTKWTNTFLGRVQHPYNQKRMAKGLYSFMYKQLKNVYGPKVAALLNVGMEKIRVKIEFGGYKKNSRNTEIILPTVTT